MSEYWFLYCRTCNSDERVGWPNHGIDRGLREVVKLLPAIARFAEALDSASHPLLDLRIGWVGPENPGYLMDFARAHAGHDVACKSEYGRFDDRCGEFYRCPNSDCQRSLVCGREKGHDGEHQTHQ